MILALELVGAFVGGAVTAGASMFLFARQMLRQRFGGMLDLLNSPSFKMHTAAPTSSSFSGGGGTVYSTAPGSVNTKPENP